jgi:hypothetical protein
MTGPTAECIQTTCSALASLVTVVGEDASKCLYFRCLSSNECEGFFSTVRNKRVTFTVSQWAEHYGTATLVYLQRLAGLVRAGYAARIGRHTNNYNKCATSVCSHFTLTLSLSY